MQTRHCRATKTLFHIAPRGRHVNSRYQLPYRSTHMRNHACLQQPHQRILIHMLHLLPWHHLLHHQQVPSHGFALIPMKHTTHTISIASLSHRYHTARALSTDFPLSSKCLSRTPAVPCCFPRRQIGTMIQIPPARPVTISSHQSTRQSIPRRTRRTFMIVVNTIIREVS